MGQHRITLTDTVIKHLIMLPELSEQFPFLKYAKASLKSKEKRSCCGQRRRSFKAPAQVYETVKASIAHLPPDRLAIIKKALNALELTIVVNVRSKDVTYVR
jgi:hypothetical protein